jgi:hypothetical protein
MKYVIAMQVDPTVLEHLTDDQHQALQEGHAAFIASTKANGEFIATQALGDPSRSKVVRGGEVPEVTDGPFAEAKEQLAGYCLIECESEERALEIAARWPDASINGVELRPLMTFDAADV